MGALFNAALGYARRGLPVFPCTRTVRRRERIERNRARVREPGAKLLTEKALDQHLGWVQQLAHDSLYTGTSAAMCAGLREIEQGIKKFRAARKAARGRVARA